MTKWNAKASVARMRNSRAPMSRFSSPTVRPRRRTVHCSRMPQPVRCRSSSTIRSISAAKRLVLSVTQPVRCTSTFRRRAATVLRCCATNCARLGGATDSQEPERSAPAPGTSSRLARSSTEHLEARRSPSAGARRRTCRRRVARRATCARRDHRRIPQRRSARRHLLDVLHRQVKPLAIPRARRHRMQSRHDINGGSHDRTFLLADTQRPQNHAVPRRSGSRLQNFAYRYRQGRAVQTRLPQDRAEQPHARDHRP